MIPWVAVPPLIASLLAAAVGFILAFRERKAHHPSQPTASVDSPRVLLNRP
jgi:hypothetical protein